MCDPLMNLCGSWPYGQEAHPVTYRVLCIGITT